MGREGFIQVFAPTASEVRQKRDQHRKAAWDCFWVLLALAVSTATCLYLLMSDAGKMLTGTALEGLVAGATFLLLGAIIIAVIAMSYHNTKANYFANVLDSEYIPHHYFRETELYN